MSRRGLICVAVFLLTGCNAVDKLTGGSHGSRNDDYEFSSPAVEIPREEPYAVLSGYHVTGEKLYIIYWTGNTLDNQSMLESDINDLGLTKYRS